MYDLVVRNGRVIDGTGSPAYGADIGVTDGKIAFVGRIHDKGAKEIDANGLVVAPGFIDGHTHMDAQVFWDEIGSNSCWHGVTTVIMGNCGFSIAPTKASDADLVIRNLERAEDIPQVALRAGLRDWTWESFGEYLDAVDARPKGINYGAYVGHSALRTWAMGDRAFTDTANDEDLDRIEGALREALEAGALGFSTSRSHDHETTGETPVASRMADWSELERLVHLLGATGNAIFQFPATGMAMDENEPDEVLAERLYKLIDSAGVTMMSVIPAMHEDAHDQRFMLDFLDRVNESSHGRAIGQVQNQTMSVVTSFKSKMPFDTVPEWAEVRALPLEEQEKILRDPTQRAELVDAANHGHYKKALAAEARKPKDYGQLRLFVNAFMPNPTIRQLADESGLDPIDVIIDKALETNFEQLFEQQIANSNEVAVLAGIKHRSTVIGGSDAGAHVNQLCAASMHSGLLAYWVREKQEFTLEQGVKMITQDVAQAWGLADRGQIGVGKMADLVVFDPETIAPAAPMLVNDLPGDAMRIKQTADGIAHVIVNGEVLLNDGVDTGARSGQLLRRRPNEAKAQAGAA